MPSTKEKPNKSAPNKESGGRGQKASRSGQSSAQSASNPKAKTPADGDTTGSGHSSKKAQSPGTYVDNEKNRKLGRVGMPKGSMPEIKGATTGSDRTSNPNQESFGFSKETKTIRARKIDENTYSDTSSSASDKSLHKDVDRDSGSRSKASIEHQERNKQGKVVKTHTDIDDCQAIATSPTAGKQIKVYKDNPLNRRLNRVGLPIGTCVFSATSKCIDQQTYKDTSENRKLQRVGKPRGCMPLQKKSSVTMKIPEMLKRIENDDEFKEFVYVNRSSTEGLSFGYQDETGARVEAFDEAMYRYNRKNAEKAWNTDTKKAPKTQEALLENYKGKNIPFDDIKLYSVIGKGGFGVVYFAKLNDTVVAVKKLQAEKISSSRIKDFSEEIKKSCALKHPNIVKFIGACTEKLNLCIVMEYMQMTLFDALHIRNDTDFTESEQISIIQQICEGMNYLHNKRIVHCDLKTSNILLDYVQNKVCDVKITDFGLSMIIHDTSVSVEEMVRNIGTPRYSAPEMLRGETLSAKDMKKADVYSLALIFLEVIFREEPFPDYSLIQLQKGVGERGATPEIPEFPNIVQNIKEIMQQAWSYEPISRPSVARICEIMHDIQFIYMQ